MLFFMKNSIIQKIHFSRYIQNRIINKLGKNFMAKIKTRRVKIVEVGTKYVTLLFLDQHCQIQLPRITFLHRKELGLYEILNPGFLKLAV